MVAGPVAVVLAMAPRVGSAELYIDGSLYASAAPGNLTWDSHAVSDGSHVLAVKSFSDGGRFLGGQAIVISVQNGDPTPTPTTTATSTAIATPIPTMTPDPFTPIPTVTATPTVVVTPAPTVVPTPLPPSPTITPTPISAAVIITAPGDGAHIEGTISIAALKSSSAVWMNFYVDGTYIASSPPSAILWDSTSVTDGAHTLSVKGFDSSSTVIAAPAVTVIVDNVAGVPSPTVTPTTTATPKASVSSTPMPTGSPTPGSDPLRPSNNIPNNRAPTAAELAAFHTGIGACGGLDDCSYMGSVDGRFSGTTEQIIEQVADKWCPDCTIVNPLDGLTYSFRDLLKAVAVNETGWHQWRAVSLSSPDAITGTKTLTPSHGDIQHVTSNEPNGGSWGLFQIAEGVGQGWPASFPLSAQSTAFNADFKTAEQMGVERGELSYLGDPERSVIAINNGFAPYVDYIDAHGVLHRASTDVNQRRWGAVGNWYSGGWYDAGALQYINQVQQILHDQPWTRTGF